MKPKKIILFGLFGQQNLGNDCTLQAMVHHTQKRLPDAEIKCICTGPEDLTTRYGIPAFDMYAPPHQGEPWNEKSPSTFLGKLASRARRELLHGVRAFRILKDNDLLIVPGTGLLVDHSTGFRGYPYYLLKWAIIARLCACRVFIVSVGAGPIHHPLSKFFIKTALSLAEYRSYRDAFSKEYIDRIGFKANGDPVYPDLAFSLPQSALPRASKRQELRLVVGVGLIDYYGQGSKQGLKGQDAYHEYIDKNGAFIEWLLDNEYRVRLIIGDVQYDTTARNDVLEYLKNRGVGLGDGRIIAESIHSVEDLLAQLEGTDIVVSPRFHNIILALMLNKKAISLSYNYKFESLMAELGLGEYCFSIDGLDVDSLINQFIELEKKAETLVPSLGQKTEEYRIALDRQYYTILNELWRK